MFKYKLYYNDSGRVGMSDRDKLLQIMDSLESDYKAGKISPEKYSYFRSKYEDKLNSIDAKEATQRIRSMQGKPSSNTSKKKRTKRPARNKKDNEQDLVQKYIINPKKDDVRYNKKEKRSMDSGTFKLFLLLILVIGFTVGVGYGIFNLDFNNLSDTNAVAIVTDTAFPEIHEDIVENTTYTYDNSSYYDSSDDVETTEDSSYSYDTDTYQSDYGYDSQYQSSDSYGQNEYGGNG